MNALATGPAVSSPDVLCSPRRVAPGSSRERKEDFVARIFRRFLIGLGLQAEDPLAVEAEQLNLDEIYELTADSTAISHVEFITEEPVEHTDLRDFLEHSPPLDAAGRVTFSLRRADLPELDWEI